MLPESDRKELWTGLRYQLSPNRLFWVFIYLCQRLIFGGGVESIIADGSANGHVIFLFDKAVVVFVICPSAGERNVVVIAILPQLPIDELTTIGLNRLRRGSAMGIE